MPGVKKVEADLGRDLFTVAYDQDAAGVADFLNAVEALGFEPRIVESALVSTPLQTADELPDRVRSQLNHGDPVLVYFGARWCGACKIMERTTFVDEAVSTRLEGFGVLKIDVESDPGIASAFSVSAVPTIVVLASNGAELYRWVGPLNPAEMALVLEEFAP